MAATDQFYRKQKTLDVVFALSCVLMLLSVLWMLVQDFNREFKSVQREFRDVETAMSERAMLERLPDDEDTARLDDAQKQIFDARRDLQKVQDAEDAATRDVAAKKVRHEAAFQDVKAQLDSKASLYSIEIDHRDEAAEEARRAAFDKKAREIKEEMNQLEKQMQDFQRQIDDDQAKLRESQAKVKAKDKELALALAPKLRERDFKLPADDQIDSLSQLEDSVKKVTTEFDRYAKTAAQRRWKTGDWFRSLPIIDGFASPYKIQQVMLADLTIDYGGFKEVPRYDRCITCHLGIDKARYTPDALGQLKETSDALKSKLATARKFYQDRAARNETLGFDPSDLPGKVAPLPLSSSQVKQFCAHPRLDLFVDANSPHPVQKFGCTTCHAGQGSATDFLNASHSPNDAVQKKEWHKQYGWRHDHFWDFPMTSARFVESSCVKCHHEITDLIRYGSKEEAPKLLRGYNLVRENGCFGCHEIAGFKNGRSIGPDLRLEPSPPLDALTSNEQAKMLSDPSNPPGNLRRVGPSLRRLSEKTNESWVRKWVQSPRGFRPDTKMPHFYGLSNNHQNDLPQDQKAYPNAEIHAIAYYLMKESGNYLDGCDTCRKVNESRKRELEDKKSRNLISVKESQELIELTRRIELAGVPVRISKEIIDGNGKPVAMPAFAQDAKSRQEQALHGRRLFTERGCLACHSHAGTEEAEGNIPPLKGDAHFGPNLSRVAAKLGTLEKDGHLDQDSARRWLMQWLLNPNVHHPRTRMPITHLTPEQARDIAEWLLSRRVQDWDEADVPEPTLEDLRQLARVYLAKGPGVSRQEVEDVLKPKDGNSFQGFENQRVQRMTADADERFLEGPIDAKKLKFYIGKKSIGRMGCFGCHDIPGFELAKPVGVPLNDWGKKDPERIAFEDIAAYVAEHYNIADRRDDPHADKQGQPSESWMEAAKKDLMKLPYEKFFADALLHHQREGFLYQKLAEPRSYDYHRDRTWDDRLRMPQFKFTYTKRQPGESEEEYKARTERDEAEAREAVMTFILGLVAEPVSLRYLNHPQPDRLAAIKGRQVLDKYNCAGCHQVRAGVYEFTMTPEVRKALETTYRGVALNLGSDHIFPEHNAWMGRQAPSAERVLVHGDQPKFNTDTQVLSVRLTDALRFQDTKNRVHDMPAASRINIPIQPDVSLTRSDPYGGTFADLLIPYLGKRSPDEFGNPDNARSALPPPLIREGERVQPEWLFQFLRDPKPVRPQSWLALRMPKFNMSDDEARALVNYFAAVDRRGNPGIGLEYPYVMQPEREETYWHKRNQQYVNTLAKEKKLDARAKEFVAELERRLQGDKKRVQAIKEGPDRQRAEKENEALDAQLKALQEALSKQDAASLRRHLADADLYWTDAYRLLATPGKSFCLECHRVGSVESKKEQGPALELSYDRLRPDWTKRWIANPQRLFGYDTGMPQNFPNQPDPTAKPALAELMNAPAIQQIEALRDVLLNFPKVSNLPANRYYRSVTGGK